VNLLLLPIVVSIYCALGFSAPILIGAGMLIHRGTARLGRRILVYSSTSLLAGLVGCWIGFGLMLMAWPAWESYLLIQTRTYTLSLPVALCWAGGPAGIAIGAVMARRLLASKA
jgi:hypothetical protein